MHGLSVLPFVYQETNTKHVLKVHNTKFKSTDSKVGLFTVIVVRFLEYIVPNLNFGSELELANT